MATDVQTGNRFAMSRFFRAFHRNGNSYLQLFLGICLSNILVFGHLGDPSSYRIETIYAFEGSQDELFDSVVRMIHEQGASANDIINTFMNQKDPVGAHFVCESTFCPMFHSPANKKSFVEGVVLFKVIHPIWYCLNPSDKPLNVDFLEFGKDIPTCYHSGLDIVATNLTMESQAVVASANEQFRKFEVRVREVRTELEWPLAERKAQDVFEQHRVLLSAVSDMRNTCSENASGVNFCDEIPVSSSDLGEMQGNLKMLADTGTRISIEDSRQTFMGFVLKMLSSAILGVAIAIGIHMLAHIMGRHPPIEALRDPSHTSSQP